MTFEAAVASLMAQTGLPRVAAELQVRRELPHLAPPSHPIAGEKDDRALEKAEQVEIRKLFIAYGFTVRNLSQYRPSKIALGFPDLFVTHDREAIAFFWETKRQVGGERSPAQVVFAEDCARTGILCGHGDRFAAAQWLVDLGLAIRIDDRIEPARLYTPLGATNNG